MFEHLLGASGNGGLGETVVTGYEMDVQATMSPHSFVA